jgi:hypothetical protein
MKDKKPIIEFQVEVWKGDERMVYKHDEVSYVNVSSNGLLQIDFKDGSEVTYSGFPFRILKYIKQP